MDHVISKCRSTVGLINRFCKEFKDATVARTLYIALARSVIEYAAPVWYPSHYSLHIERLEAIQKRFTISLLGCRRSPGAYAIMPYADRCKATFLDPISVRHKLAGVMVIHDVLLGYIRCPYFRQHVRVNPNRRGRNSRYLYPALHRTNYGYSEPITKCVIVFNTVADIFLSGHSRRVFRNNTLARLAQLWFGPR
jgi:hypothetical protein